MLIVHKHRVCVVICRGAKGEMVPCVVHHAGTQNSPFPESKMI